MWACAYKICFKSISDNDFIWFQYRVLFRILGTKYRLKKFNLSQSDVCSLCTEHPETIEHLFCFCTETTQIWDNIRLWIKNKLNINIRLTEVMKFLGYCIKDENFWPGVPRRDQHGCACVCICFVFVFSWKLIYHLKFN